MQYFTIDEKLGKYIEYSEENEATRVVIKSELEEQTAQAKARLVEIPQPPSDKELLEWAKANHPQMDYSVEKQNLTEVVSTNAEIINALEK